MNNWECAEFYRLAARERFVEILLEGMTRCADHRLFREDYLTALIGAYVDADEDKKTQALDDLVKQFEAWRNDDQADEHYAYFGSMIFRYLLNNHADLVHHFFGSQPTKSYEGNDNDNSSEV